MTDSEILELAKSLKTHDAPFMVVDGKGLVRDVQAGWGPAPGDSVFDWAPDWEAADRQAVAVGAPLCTPVLRTAGHRWIRVRQLAVAEELTLHILEDWTCDYVAEEARELAVRRSARSALAGATAREMNDAMTIVQGRLELLRAFALENPEAADRHCSIALEHSARLSATLHNLRMVGASAISDGSVVDVAAALESAFEVAGVPTVSVVIDLHPAEIAVCGQFAATKAVLAAIIRAMGADGRDPLSVTGRLVDGMAVIRLAGGSRRRERDGLLLGIATTLLDVMGGRIEFSGDGSVIASLPSAPNSEPALDPGTLLVVGSPRFVDNVSRLLADSPLLVVSENSAEAGLTRARRGDLAGVVSQLLLPAHCGLSMVEALAREGIQFSHGSLLMVPEPVSRLPENVRVLTAPWSRSRLLTALAQS